MALYDGGPLRHTVSGGGGGCCGGLLRVALLFITALNTTFTVGSLVVTGAALYSVYNDPAQYAVDQQGLVQLWILVTSGGVAVFTNACGFVGALLRIRCLLLLYALVTGLTAAGHLAVAVLQRAAGQHRHLAGRLNITGDPRAIWTAEMHAYARQVMGQLRSAGGDVRRDVDEFNNTMTQLHNQLTTGADAAAADTALKTVNSIQTLLKCCGTDGVQDYIGGSLTTPASCCVAAARCNATLRRRPQLDPAAARHQAHPRGCGPLLAAAHRFVETVITWLGYVVAGSQLCGAVVATVLALCCDK